MFETKFLNDNSSTLVVGGNSSLQPTFNTKEGKISNNNENENENENDNKDFGSYKNNDKKQRSKSIPTLNLENIEQNTKKNGHLDVSKHRSISASSLITPTITMIDLCDESDEKNIKNKTPIKSNRSDSHCSLEVPFRSLSTGNVEFSKSSDCVFDDINKSDSESILPRTTSIRRSRSFSEGTNCVKWNETVLISEGGLITPPKKLADSNENPRRKASLLLLNNKKLKDLDLGREQEQGQEHSKSLMFQVNIKNS
eukprot:Pgem_evm1s1184